MNNQKLEEAVSNYGTPLYVFDIDILHNTARKFKDGLDNKVNLCYAMKANPFVVKYMQDVVDRIEVCSMGEFRICKALNIIPEKILVSGVLKKEDDILEILEYCGGRCCYTVESLTHYDIFVRWCREHKEKIRLYLRLTSGNQFGMDKEVIESIIKDRESNPYIEIVGIHYFSGTQKKNVGKIKTELEFLDKICIELESATNFKIKELEYGPGFAVSYFENQNDTSDADIAELKEALDTMCFDGIITFEMGRAFAATCGYYMTSVWDVKCNNGKNYCIVDGGLHQMNYDGQIRGMYKPVTNLLPERSTGNIDSWNVCGALCTANDVLVQNVSFDDLKIGDVIAFSSAGAYSVTEGMALFLSHSLPAVATYSEDEGFSLIREKIKTFTFNMKSN